MSWSITDPALRDGELTAAAAKAAIAADESLPQPIKDYIAAGIDGLVAFFGANPTAIRVRVSGGGHVCHGNDNLGVTDASLRVEPAAAHVGKTELGGDQRAPATA